MIINAENFPITMDRFGEVKDLYNQESLNWLETSKKVIHVAILTLSLAITFIKDLAYLTSEALAKRISNPPAYTSEEAPPPYPKEWAEPPPYPSAPEEMDFELPKY